MSLHRQKNQERDYSVSETDRIVCGGKSSLGLTYVSERLRGRIVKSEWFSHVDEDGTIYKLNVRIRKGLTATGKEFVKKDRTLLVSNIGAVTLAEVAESGTHLMHTSLGVVCMSCLTSDHVLEDKDGRGWTCTRCGSWIKSI